MPVGLVATLALAVLVAPLAAHAQPAGKVYRIGFLRAGQLPTAWVEAFQQGLRERGYIDGQNVIVEFRVTDGSLDPLPQLAEELVRSKVDVILASSSPPAVAAKNATTSVPIVFVNVFDPVEIGLVPSLARPGGNITGLASTSPEFAGKCLELLKEIVPQLRRVAVLSHPATPSNPMQLKGTEDAARARHAGAAGTGPRSSGLCVQGSARCRRSAAARSGLFHDATRSTRIVGGRKPPARDTGTGRWWTPEASCRTVCTSRISTGVPPHT